MDIPILHKWTTISRSNNPLINWITVTYKLHQHTENKYVNQRPRAKKIYLHLPNIWRFTIPTGSPLNRIYVPLRTGPDSIPLWKSRDCSITRHIINQIPNYTLCCVRLTPMAHPRDNIPHGINLTIRIDKMQKNHPWAPQNRGFFGLFLLRVHNILQIDFNSLCCRSNLRFHLHSIRLLPLEQLGYLLMLM